MGRRDYAPFFRFRFGGIKAGAAAVSFAYAGEGNPGNPSGLRRAGQTQELPPASQCLQNPGAHCGIENCGPAAGGMRGNKSDDISAGLRFAAKIGELWGDRRAPPFLGSAYISAEMEILPASHSQGDFPSSMAGALRVRQLILLQAMRELCPLFFQSLPKAFFRGDFSSRFC